MDRFEFVATRSVSLTAKDAEDLELLRASKTHRATLEDCAGISVGASPSDAQLLHAVLLAGLRAVREEVEDAGYAQMSRDRDENERKTSARRRQRP